MFSTNTKKNIKTYTIAIILMVSCLGISTLIDNEFLKNYFPYTSVLLLIAVTAYLFKKEGKTLQEIGLTLQKQSVFYLFFGTFLGILFIGIATLLKCLYTGEEIALSSNLSSSTLMYAFYLILPTVAVEELLFRGYLFKKTIALSSVVVANSIFSVLFLLIHLDENILQNKAMLLLLVTTIPIGHLLFATTLLQSKTILFPIGLHLGNNWATRHLISNSDTEGSIFYILEKETFETWPYFIGFLVVWNGFYLLMTFIIWKWKPIASFIKSIIMK